MLTIIRHNNLENPYKDYKGLSVDVLDDLSTGRLSPSIEKLEKIPSCYSNNDIDELKNCERFICSKIRRTKDSCLALQNLLQINKEITEDELLNEVYFSTKKLIKNPNNNPLLEIRENFYKDLYLNTGAVEDIENLLDRCDEMLEKYRSKNVVCFSHGFLIRFLNAYKLSGFDRKKWIDYIDETDPVDYLEIHKI